MTDPLDDGIDPDDEFHGRPTTGPVDLGPGSKLGLYTLIEPLGRGGMGQVWKATDGKRPVAVKLLPPEFRGDAAAVAQVDLAFRRVHALTHENICKALGLVDDAAHGPYLVMDYVPGITLTSFHRRAKFDDGRMPLDLAAEILRPIAAALDYAHQKVMECEGREVRGVLHRDIKPDNILVVPAAPETADPVNSRAAAVREIWLIDFGLAAEISRSTRTRTNAGAGDMRGTRPYMSPEQIKGKRHLWDGRTDQYGLAVVAYELLAGHLPFDADDDFALMLAIGNEPAEPISQLADAVNGALLKGLSKSRDERYVSCKAFVEALTSTSVSQPPSRAESTAGASTASSRPPSIPTVVPSAATKTSAPETPESKSDTHTTVRQRFGARKLELPIERTNAIGMQLRMIPKGEFVMGSSEQDLELLAKFSRPISRDRNPERPHRVRITNAFWLGKFPVTRGQFRVFIQSTGYRTEAEQEKSCTRSWERLDFPQTDDHPVCYVTWNDARAFTAWLSKQTQEAVSLPTEAQWEWACRAGTSTVFPSGDDSDQIVSLANVADAALLKQLKSEQPHGASASDRVRGTTPVGSFDPNRWGLHDMIGNVSEWCADFYHDQYYDDSPLDDPAGPVDGSRCVHRGGSWNYDASHCRSAQRHKLVPGLRSWDVGFRIAVKAAN